MKKLILTFLVWGTAVLPAFSQTYEELGALAVTAAEQDSLTQAKDYIMKALKLEPANPHNALLFSNLGTIQRRQNQYDKALESYSYALNITPRAVPVLLNRAAVYLELGKNELARVDYSLALDMEADNQEALLMRSYVYVQKHDYKAARSDYKRLLNISPLSYSGRLGLATLEQKEGRYDESLTLLDKMIEDRADGEARISDELCAILYVARAGVEKDMQHLDMALIDLEEALKLDESLEEAYLMRGQIYLSQKKKKMAKRAFEKAILLGIPQSEMRHLLQECK